MRHLGAIVRSRASLALVSKSRSRDLLRSAVAWTTGSLPLYFSWSSILTLAGAAGLAIASVEDWRHEVRNHVPSVIWSILSEYKIWVVIGLVALTLLPAVIADGNRKLRQLRFGVFKNVELTTSAESISDRLAHLITKSQDAKAGIRDDRYIAHTLDQITHYFKSRALAAARAAVDDRIEVALYRAKWPSNGRQYFERFRQTHTEASEFDFKLTAYQNDDGRRLIQVLLDGGYLFAENEADLAFAHSAFAIPATRRAFEQYIIVPVCVDRKKADQERLWGALIMMSTRNGMLQETDAKLLTTYSWLISVAQAIDAP